MGIGSARNRGLAEARAKAAECRRLVVEGKDPIRERLAARLEATVAATEQMTFDQWATAYIAAHKDGWRNSKHAAQWESTLRLHASPVIGTLPVADIALPKIMKILEPIWRDKTETATRIRGRVECSSHGVVSMSFVPPIQFAWQFIDASLMALAWGLWR